MQDDQAESGSWGRLIRAHRLRAGLSQEDLARLSGVSTRSIRNIEGQNRRPRASTLRILAETLALPEHETAALVEAVRPEARFGPDRPAPPASPPPVFVPRQLPAPPRAFTAREAELAQLDGALLASGSLLWLITGSGGLGKTWLAVHWANDRREEFPDGQLYLNLRGFDPEAEPTSARAALRSLVSALGVPADSAPGDLDDLSALYRSVTAGRRLLVLLDNARDAAQVAPLLPGGTDCTTVVTSRDSLRELITGHGARLTRLETLAPAASRRVLGTHVGRQRLNRDPEAVARLVEVSAGLPLALGIIGSLAAQYPKQPLSAIVAELSPASTAGPVDGGELGAGLRTVLDGSRRWLDPEAARLFDLLGLAPGTGCDRYAAASLADRDLPRVRRLLRRLEDACLIDQDAPGHYRMHDLTHGYANECALERIPPAEREAALRRLVDHYAASAQRAGQSMQPGLDSVGEVPTVPGVLVAPIADRTAALEWQRREESNLIGCQELALRHDWHRPAWWIADGLAIFSDEQLLGHEVMIRIWQTAVAAAEQLGDLERVRALRMLGRARAAVDPTAEAAVSTTEAALRLATKMDDKAELANAHFQLSFILGNIGRTAESLEHGFQTLANLSDEDNPRRLANIHNRLCWELAESGRHEEAEKHGRLSLSIARENRLDFVAAMVLNSLGYAAFKAGRSEEAVEHYRRAHAIYTQVESNRYTEFNLDYLGDALHSLGRTPEALAAWRDAADRSEAAFRFKEAERVRAKIAAA